MRIMRNQEPLGVLIPNDLWEDFVENLEALSSPNYLRSIEESRKAPRSEDLTSDEIKKKLGIK